MANFGQGMLDALRGKSTGTETQTRTPMDADYNQEQFWRQFEEMLYGTQSAPSGTPFDADYYIRRYPDIAKAYGINPQAITDKDRQKARKHYDKYGMKEGRVAFDQEAYAANQGPPANAVKPLSVRLDEDIAHKKAADEKYGSEMGGLRTGYLDTLGQNNQGRMDANQLFGQQMGQTGEAYLSKLLDDTNQWQGQTNQVMDSVRPLATAAPMNIKFGDFTMPFVTGSQAYSQNTLNRLNDKTLTNQNHLGSEQKDTRQDQHTLENTIANKGFDLKDLLNTETLGKMGEQAGLENQIAGTYTPNMSTNMLMDMMMNLWTQGENRRFGMPQTENSATYSPTMWDIAGNVAKIYGATKEVK